MTDEGHTAAQQLLIDWQQQHPDGSRWKEVSVDDAQYIFAGLLHAGAPGDGTNLDGQIDALIVFVHRLVDEVGVESVLGAIQLADESDLRSQLSRFKVPYQKEMDAAWLSKVLRRADTPYGALCLNAVVGLAYSDRMRDVIADLFEHPGDALHLSSIEQFFTEPPASVAHVVSLLAAAVEHQLVLNGNGPATADRLFLNVLQTASEYTGSSFLDGLLQRFRECIDRYQEELLEADLDILSVDDTDWSQLAKIVSELADSRSRSGLLVPRAVLEADDPISASEKAFSEVVPRLIDLCEQLRQQSLRSLRVALLLGSEGGPPRTLAEIVSTREDNEPDAVLVELARLSGPPVVQPYVDVIKERARGLADAGSTAPEDLKALHALVAGSRDLANADVFTDANPAMGKLSTVAYAGELAISEYEAEADAVRDPVVDPAAQAVDLLPADKTETDAPLSAEGTNEHQGEAFVDRSSSAVGESSLGETYTSETLIFEDASSLDDPHSGDEVVAEDNQTDGQPPLEDSQAPETPSATLPDDGGSATAGRSSTPVDEPEAARSGAATSDAPENSRDDRHADDGREAGRVSVALQEAAAAPDNPSAAEYVGTNGTDAESDSAQSDGAGDSPADRTVSADVFNVALGNGRFGAAQQIAALSDGGAANLWRFVALADAVASGTGPVAGAINTAAEELVHGTEVDGIGGERGHVLVAYLAAVRAALVAPHTAATSVLSAVARSLPSLESLTDAIILTSRQGVALIDHVLTQAADLSDAELKVGEAADAVVRWRSEAAARSIKYHRATEVLRILVADNGPIGALCVEAGAQYPDERSRREAADRVLAKVTELRDDKAASEAFAAAHAKAFEIHSGALERLRSYWHQGLDLAAAWAAAVIALDTAREAGDDAWQAGFLRKLQDAQAQCATTLDDLVAELQSDPSDRVRALGTAAGHLLASVRSLLVGERPNPTFEQPEAVVNFDLLAVEGARLGPDWKLLDGGCLSEPGPLEQLRAAVSSTPSDALREAFEVRLNTEDHVGTRLCLEALALLGVDDLDDLAQRDAAEADAAREAVTSVWRDTEDLLAADARLGYLDETTRRAWTADLYAVHPSGRDDIDLCRATIEAIRSRSSQNRVERTEEIRDEIAAVAEAEPPVAAALDRILARVAAGDLATAWEYVSLAREGTSIPEPPAPLVDIGEFFPDRDRVLEEQANLGSRAVAAAAAAGDVSGPLDFAGLSPADRVAAKEGLDAWRTMSKVSRPGKDYREWASSLPTVLATLGITADKFDRSPLTGGKEHDRLWVDLTGVTTTGDPIVPAFAPDPGGRRVMRLLAITGGQDGGQLEAAIDRDRSGDPVLVLHHGPLGPELRAEIAERFRAMGRAVAVVDDDLFAHLVETGSRRYERTMGLVLPFTTTNPYHLDVSGLVPETMFFGRRAERDAIMDRYGTSHLYGGRQLGKSALLRHVERAFNATPNQVAIYVDLKGAQVGMPRPPQAVFDVLWGPLAHHGIVEGDLPAANVPEAVAAGIDSWLAARPGRRLLVLLDECDNFLKADKDRDLATSARLKDLMERTDRACKFVFAGLHTVQRFSSVANTPMAHLGTPIAIGPLEGAAAADLITKPMHALGYRFSQPELVNRILAHTSRHPALLVIFCHHLLRKLQSRRRLLGEPPFTITEADVDGTWSDPEVAAAIRERVQWTLALDPAYEVITYVIAHLASAEGGRSDHRIPVRDLQAECTYWWPQGFDGYLPEQFRLLADELIGLGVLAREGSRYGLRNPNVARLLGTSEEIETVLAGAHLKQPEQTFEPATWRRPVQGADGRTFRSPLSHEQLDRLTAPSISATVVTGTEACGIGRVAEAIEAAAGGRTKVTPRGWQDPIDRMLQPVGEDRHRIAVVDLRGAPGPNASAIIDSVVDAIDPERPRSGSRGTWAVVLVVDAVRDGAVLRHALRIPSLGTVALQRWSPAAISAFGRDAGFPFAGVDEAASVAERTGGWGYLVDRVAEQVAGATTLAAVLDDAETDQLVARIGFGEDPVVTAAFEVAAGLVTGPEDRCDLETLAAILDESPLVREALRVSTARTQLPETSGSIVAEQLVLAALLDAGPGGNVWVERVTAEAFAAR